MRVSNFWLFLIFPVMVFSDPGVDIAVVNDTVMKVKYVGYSPESIDPIVFIEGKRIGLESHAGTRDPVAVKAVAKSSEYSHAITGLRATATNDGGYGVYTVGIQGEALGAENNDLTYGGIFTANDGLVNTGVLATADGSNAIAIRGIGYGSGSLAGEFDGNVVITGSLNTLSDGRLKKNIRGIDSALAKVNRLRPVMYEMKADEYKGRVVLADGSQYGVIAEEAGAVVPHLIRSVSIIPVVTAEEVKNRVKKEKVEYSSVDYIGFIPLLLKAMQEQQALIQAQQMSIEALNTKVAALQRR